MKKTTPGIGYSLMIFGFIGVIGCTLFILTANDLEGIRAASILNFVCMLTFMLGSILEIKELWFALTISTKDKKPANINKGKSMKTPIPTYIPKKKSLASELLYLTIIIIVILFIALLVWSQ